MGLLLLVCPARPLVAASPTRSLGWASAPLTVRTLSGSQAPWRAQIAGTKRTLIVFMTIWCKACARKQADVVRWARRSQKTTRTLFVFSGSPLAEVARLVRERGIPLDVISVLVDRDRVRPRVALA